MSNTVSRTHHSKSWIAGIAVVGICLIVVGEFGAARGPYYLGKNNDPDYVYLLSSLGFLKGEVPVHTDHPGTPVQLIGAGAIGLVHLIAGDGPLVKDVLHRPEFYLISIRIVNCLILASMLLLLVRWSCRLDFSLGVLAGLLLMPLASPQILYGVCTFSPDALLGIMSCLFGFCLFYISQQSALTQTWKQPFWIGVLGGVGMAVKMNFLPLFIVPLVLFQGWKNRAWVIGGIAVGFIGSVIPILPRWGERLSWYWKVFSHTGYYGEGGTGVIDTSIYFGHLVNLIKNEPLLFVSALGGLWLGLPALRLTASNQPDTAVRRLMLGISLAQLAQFIAVSKHPHLRYLLPALCLIGLQLALFWRWIEVRSSHTHKTSLRSVWALSLVTVLVFSGWNGVWFRQRKMEDQAGATEVVRQVRILAQSSLIIEGYGTSSPAYAMKFGNSYGEKFTKELTQEFPDAIFYDTKTSEFSDMGKVISLAEVIQRAGDRPVFLQCEYVLGHVSGLSGFRLTELTVHNSEAIFVAVPDR